MKHPCFREPDSILEKLRKFHYEHQTAPDQALGDLEIAVGQLPYNTCGREAEVVTKMLEANTPKKRDAVAVNLLLDNCEAGIAGAAKQSNLSSGSIG